MLLNKNNKKMQIFIDFIQQQYYRKFKADMEFDKTIDIEYKKE